VLKCDIKKFFASIDHTILLVILERHIPDQDVLGLLAEIIESFHTTRKGEGLPLGNLTSQLFANIYLNELDQYMKHTMKARFYIRYADDFVILSHNKEYLKYVLPCIDEFLKNNIRLALHPNKIFISTIASGVDFLGWVHFPDHRVLRTTTKRRMLKSITLNEGKEEKVQSYMGLLSHGNSWKLRHKIETYF
jgi:retron-type reverse transcriptase